VFAERLWGCGAKSPVLREKINWPSINLYWHLQCEIEGPHTPAQKLQIQPLRKSGRMKGNL
jgi:hypothetical protein